MNNRLVLHRIWQKCQAIVVGRDSSSQDKQKARNIWKLQTRYGLVWKLLYPEIWWLIIVYHFKNSIWWLTMVYVNLVCPITINSAKSPMVAAENITHLGVLVVIRTGRGRPGVEDSKASMTISRFLRGSRGGKELFFKDWNHHLINPFTLLQVSLG